MSAARLIALASGMLFGAGLALSGLIDPARVQSFLDVTGAWDPTLAFVMGGAILPMTVAWRVARLRGLPVAAPPTSPIDASLTTGALLFGIGWGLTGLCPGPAIAAVAVRPLPALLFVAAMATGAALHLILIQRADSRRLAAEPS